MLADFAEIIIGEVRFPEFGEGAQGAGSGAKFTTCTHSLGKIRR